jgi:hypothetical protein
MPVNKRVYDILVHGVNVIIYKEEYLTNKQGMASMIYCRYLYTDEQNQTTDHWKNCKHLHIKLTNSSRRKYLAKAKVILQL